MGKLRNLGFSLIELLVVTAMVGMLSVGLVGIFLSTIRGRQQAQAEAYIRSQGDYVITQIERSLRFAADLPTDNTFAAPCNGASINFKVKNGDVYDDHSFTFSGTKFTRGTNDMVELKTDYTFSSYSFTCVKKDVGTPGYVKVKFAIRYKNADHTFQTRVAMRNLK